MRDVARAMCAYAEAIEMGHTDQQYLISTSTNELLDAVVARLNT